VSELRVVEGKEIHWKMMMIMMIIIIIIIIFIVILKQQQQPAANSSSSSSREVSVEVFNGLQWKTTQKRFK